MQVTAEALNQLDGSPDAAVLPEANPATESTGVIESSPAIEVAESIEVAEMGSLEWLLVGVSLLILFAFVSSFIKWIALLRNGKRPFGANALVPVSSRPRPYWNAGHFLMFYGFVLLFSVLMSVGAGALGYLDLDALRNAQVQEGTEDAGASDFTMIELGEGEDDSVVPAKSNTAEVTTSESVAGGLADPPPVEAVVPESPTISVPQLLISSFAMLFATLATMGLLVLMRPRNPYLSSSGVDGFSNRIRFAIPGFGWVPSFRLIGLGLVAAWLILPPTMLMMGAVSALQEYSHPVLDALKPSDSDAGPNFAIFAALFFTTAIVTPVVEEFWFRGLLQGGLQRLADARTDAINWGMTRSSIPAETIPEETMPPLNEAGDPFQPPQPDAGFVKEVPVTSAGLANVADPATRSDWIPNAIWPLVVASLLFALMHWGQGLAPIPLFFLSLGLGYLYRQTGSLIPSIVVHFVLNGFTMSATFLEMLR